MKHTSPTLIALAALAVAPGLAALDVKDDDVKLGLSLQLQVRGEWSDAVTADGETGYNVAEGNAGGTNDPVDFYIRRMRLGFKGSWKGDYKFAAILRVDNQDKDGNTTAQRTPQTHVAFIERVFKQEDLKLEHSIRAGLDYAFFNGSSAVFSSSGMLLPSARATDQGAMLAPRGVGIGYKLDGEFFTWGVDVQNNVSDDDDTTGDGMLYTTRVHLTPPGELAIKKPAESFLGKEGMGVMMSLEYGKNVNADSLTDRTAYGTEVLVHVDGLTALAEYRVSQDEQDTGDIDSSLPGVQSELKRNIWLLQAGYAFPMGDTVLEPAVRYTSIDLNTENEEETASYGTAEYGASGTQYEIGLNWYLHGNSNKMQIAYQAWSAEEEDADAKVLRAQWQLSF